MTLNNAAVTNITGAANFSATNESSSMSVAQPTAQKPTELMAFHMFQLAKTVRQIAGGPSAGGSVFNADAEARGAPHRNLQFAAFQVG